MENMKKKPKTTGLEWLGHSMASFNGSGYADRHSENTFVDSYIAYKTMKGLLDAADLAFSNYDFAQGVAAILLEGPGPSHVASESGWRKFKVFYP